MPSVDSISLPISQAIVKKQIALNSHSSSWGKDFTYRIPYLTTSTFLDVAKHSLNSIAYTFKTLYSATFTTLSIVAWPAIRRPDKIQEHFRDTWKNTAMLTYHVVSVFFSPITSFAGNLIRGIERTQLGLVQERVHYKLEIEKMQNPEHVEEMPKIIKKGFKLEKKYLNKIQQKAQSLREEESEDLQEEAEETPVSKRIEQLNTFFKLGKEFKETTSDLLEENQQLYEQRQKPSLEQIRKAIITLGNQSLEKPRIILQVQDFEELDYYSEECQNPYPKADKNLETSINNLNDYLCRLKEANEILKQAPLEEED